MTATIVKEPGTSSIPSEYAPLNKQDDLYGIVSYLDEGAQSVRDARRENAFKKMYESCEGKYLLLEEGNSESNPMFSTYGNTTFTTTSTTVFLKFECVSE